MCVLPVVAPQALIEDKEGENQKALRVLVKKEKPAARPVTPRVEEPPEVSKCLPSLPDVVLAPPTCFI